MNFVFLLVIPSVVLTLTPDSSPVRLCVKVDNYDTYCPDMERDAELKCVPGRDSYDCMKKVRDGEADVTLLDDLEIYSAGRFYHLAPLIREQYQNRNFRYQGVALVNADEEINSLSQLRGKRSCHTGVNRVAGWHVPIGVLRRENLLDNQAKTDYDALQIFFNSSCAPGNWSSDPTVDRLLKNKYPNLCRLCKTSNVCDNAKEEYGGYEGALKCLTERAGDVAFTKVDAVNSFVKKNPSLISQINYLCPDGTKRTIEEGPCSWMDRPTPGFVRREGDKNEIARYLSVFNQTFLRHSPSPPTWFNKTFVSSSKVSGLADVSSWNYRNYLGEYIYTIEKPENGLMRMCSFTDPAYNKCIDYKHAAYSRRLRPVLQCVKAGSSSDCIELISNGGAEIITLDGGDIYTAGKYKHLQPVAVEVYDLPDSSYYAVAVIKSQSPINSLSDLKNLRSCHTGIGRTAGWVVPIGALLDLDLIPYELCNRALSVANFFNASCVPGAKDPKYNPGLSGADTLCKQCIGDDNGQDMCSRGDEERYSGYAGAFRCLAENSGDVAFVKHSTVADYTDGKSQLPWTQGLKSSDYRLVCKNGTNQSYLDYLQCNLAQVPSHHVMISGNISSDFKLIIAEFLAQSSYFFGHKSQIFKIFTQYAGHPDLLFKDKTRSLKVVGLDKSYKDVLGENFFKASEAVDPKYCQQQLL